MRLLIFLLALLPSLPSFSQTPTVVDPQNFPEQTNPDNTNFEFYSRKGGTNVRATFNNVRKRMMPFVRQPTQVSYTPSPTGNSNDRGTVVRTPTGRTYYIDGLGNALWLNQDFVEALVIADNDAHAALLCVPLNGEYQLSETNTLGGSPGDVRRRIYGGSPPCIE